MTPSFLWDFPGSPSELVPFKYWSHPREGRGISKCESLLPSTGTATWKISHTSPRPLTILASLSPLPCLPFALFHAFLSLEQWKLKHDASLSFLKTPSQGGRVSPIFMSSKWLLSKWGHTKSHSRCHKYKWLDIGGNKPSGEIMGCTLAVMVDHTESSYISTGKVIQAFGGLQHGKKRKPGPGESQQEGHKLS